jgi:polyhydroxyalkanoate synthesis regulator phasin
MGDLRETFREIWSLALVGLSAAETEAERVLARVAEAAGLSSDEMKRQTHELGERLTSQRREIESAIDDAVRRAISHTRLPSAGEVEALSQRLERISERIEAIAKKKGGAD